MEYCTLHHLWITGGQPCDDCPEGIEYNNGEIECDYKKSYNEDSEER